MKRIERWAWPVRGLLWVDIAWAIFAVANLVGMVVFATWETVPFHFIWVSLTILYGFRVWRLKPTLSVLGAIIMLTGAVLIVDIARGTQPMDELTEVPLMSAMFLAMVWHARRRLVATEEMRRISDVNLRLLERERRFIQNASHELRTPITVAIGHAELLQRSTDPSRMAADARVVLEELMRLRRLSDRLLLLAAADDPDFLHKKPIEVEPVLVTALQRWSPTPRQWRLGTTDEAVVDADADRLALAIDALVENAVKHTTPADWIELSVRRNHGVEITVADSGTGIPAEDLDRIFERFGRSDISRQRDNGGLGLGLPIVKTIAEAHGGTLSIHSDVGKGTEFTISLPLADRVGKAVKGSPSPTPLPTPLHSP
ncbi:MAG: two-component system, OmpR family, sensor kinase [Chloroflexota bacterium]|nr:two-component system, OmpR family, sensor kinase [Chloroflexota bacterium]MEA2667937.1 two-component system, OmpR family, sensor kinase [Chloroflexota bacterium]